MATAKRKKKAKKGSARAKAAHGGKATPKKPSLGRKVSQGLTGLKESVRSKRILEALTGNSELARNQQLKAGKGVIPTDPKSTSAPLHSTINKEISDTFGPDIAAALGLAQEVFTGGANAAVGEPFVNLGGGEQGHSVEDIRSNFTGQLASQRGGGSKVGPFSQILGFTNELGFEDDQSGQKLLGRKNIMEALRSLFSRGGGRTEIPQPSSSVPRGKHGGSLMANAAKNGQSIGRVRAASGGALARGRDLTAGRLSPVGGIDPRFSKIPGIQTLPGFDQGPVTQQQGATTGTTTGTTTNQGQSTIQNTADTGALDNIVQQLQQFQGTSGAGRGTLDEILQTGLPTDVSGIANAAKIRASQEFDDAQNTIGERLANLGLVSSSAQTSAVARERAKLGERVAAAGMEAQVAADEAAAGRRFGGVGLDQQSQATQAGALGQASSGAAASAGLTSGQTRNFNETGTSSTSTAGTSRGTVSNLTPDGTPNLAIPDGRLPGGGIGSRDTRMTAGGPLSVIKASGPASGTFLGGTRIAARGAEGGRVSREDLQFQNFLQTIGADLGKTHGAKIKATSGTQEAQDVNLMAALTGLGGEAGARFLFENLSERGRLAAKGQDKFSDISTGTGKFGPQNVAQFLRFGVDAAPEEFGSKGRRGDPFTGKAKLVPDAGAGAEGASTRGSGIGSLRPGVRDQFLAGGDGVDILGPRGSQRNRQFFAEGGPVQTPRAGAVPQPVLPQENGQLVPGLLDPRRQFFDEGGGVAPGVDSGQDQVPALLRSEELVVVPELVEELMSVDPELPQPGLITALQELAQQPLEFGEEEGELVAREGGSAVDPRISFSDFIASLAQDPQSGINPQTHPELFGRAPLRFEAAPEQTSSFGSLVPSSGGAFPDPTQEAGLRLGGGPSGSSINVGDTEFELPRLPSTRQQVDLNTGTAAQDVLRPPSFSETVGEGGERKFNLTGGGTFGGPADIRGGLDPEKGLLTGGEDFAPGVSRNEGGGNFSSLSFGSSQIDPKTGLPVEFAGRQLSRLERAQHVADLTRSAIATDPIGGPEKQARMLRSLQIAYREVDSSVNELIQGQQLAIQLQQAQNTGVVAQGKLNETVARTLTAEAQKITAEGAFAKQAAEIAANDPVLAQALNFFEVLAKNPDANPEDLEAIRAAVQRSLQAYGIELTDPNFLERWFGAPREIVPVSQTQSQQGLPEQFEAEGRKPFAEGGMVNEALPEGPGAVSSNGQEELNLLMTRAKSALSAEDFQRVMDFM